MKVAFIGAGNMARFHIQAFQDINDIEIAGITSRTRHKAEAFEVPIVTDTIEELYQQTQADLVIIAVHIAETEKVLEQALLFPWKILVEKPLGHDFDAANRLIASILQKKRQDDIFVAFNRRFLSSTLFVQDALNKDGTTRIIKVQDRQSISEALAYGHPDEVAQKFMYANSIHLIDYFLLFGRDQIKAVHNHVKQDHYYMSEIEFNSGDTGIYEAIWERPGPWGVDITCREKRYELKPLEQASWQEIGSRDKHNAPIAKWDQNFKPGLRAQAEEAYKMLCGKAHTLPSVTEAFETTKLIHRIYG